MQKRQIIARKRIIGIHHANIRTATTALTPTPHFLLPANKRAIAVVQIVGQLGHRILPLFVKLLHFSAKSILLINKKAKETYQIRLLRFFRHGSPHL